MSNESFQILACASQGVGSGDETRLKALLGRFEVVYFDFDRRKKLKGFWKLITRLRQSDFDLFVIEGTGVGVVGAAIVSALFYGTRFVVSSGDAVSPYLSARVPLAKPIFFLYELGLYRLSVGFIGWTPYLVGRALTFGVKRAISVPGWAPFEPDWAELSMQRMKIRRSLNIPADAVVYGIVGTLRWSKRYSYCYGLELLKAAQQSKSKIYVLVVGDGTGYPMLREIAGEAFGKTIFLPGRVVRDQVPYYLAAMDVGCLPQSVDKVGSFRYSTKIAEYRLIGLPFISNEIPLSYDLDNGDVFRLPGGAPWSKVFIDNLADLMDRLKMLDIVMLKTATRRSTEFDKEPQISRVTQFLLDVLRSHQKKS